MNRAISCLIPVTVGLLFAACTAPAPEQAPGSEGALIATTRATAGGGTRTASEMAGDPEGIVRLNGRLYYVKDRGATLLSTREQRVTETLYLERNGEITVGDGRRVRLRNGGMVTRGGELLEAPPYLR
jgi:hypothetical protein